MWLGALDSWTGRRARVRSRLAEAEGTQSWNRMGCSNFFGLVSINCKKTGCPELVKAGYPEQIREIRKRSGNSQTVSVPIPNLISRITVPNPNLSENAKTSG